jgi:hypothetical protein
MYWNVYKESIKIDFYLLVLINKVKFLVQDKLNFMD